MPKPALLSAQLMNGYSDMWTKLRLGALYPGVKGHAKAPDRMGNQSRTELPVHTCRKDTKVRGELPVLIYLHYLGAPLGTVLWFVGHTRAIEQEERGSNSEIMKAH